MQKNLFCICISFAKKERPPSRLRAPSDYLHPYLVRKRFVGVASEPRKIVCGNSARTFAARRRDVMTPIVSARSEAASVRLDLRRRTLNLVRHVIDNLLFRIYGRPARVRARLVSHASCVFLSLSGHFLVVRVSEFPREALRRLQVACVLRRVGEYGPIVLYSCIEGILKHTCIYTYIHTYIQTYVLT